MLPQDPVILQSVVNTALRDRGISLEEFCRAEDLDENDLKEKLAAIGAQYDENTRAFR